MHKRTATIGAAIFAFATLASGPSFADTTTPAADNSADPSDVSVQVQTFSADAFTAEAADLDPALRDAIKEGLDKSPEQYLADAAAAKNASDVVDALVAQGIAVNGARLDDDGGVTIAIADGSDAAAVEGAGATALVGELSVADPTIEDLAISSPAAADTIGGGAPILRSVGGQRVSVCTSGFGGFDAQGNTSVLTAGHCADADWSQYELSGPFGWNGGYPAPLIQNETSIGTVDPTSVKFGQGSDSELIVGDAGISPLPSIAAWGQNMTSGSLAGQVDIYGTMNPILGMDVCKAGQRTGWSCGTVFKLDGTIELEGGIEVTSVFTTVCLGQGDSGGPNVSGNYAVGITSTLSGLQFEDNDSPDACNMNVQVQRYKDNYLHLYPVSQQPLVLEILANDPKQLIHSSFFAANSSTQLSANDHYGDNFQLAVVVAPPVLTGETTVFAGGTLTGTVANAGIDHKVVLTVDGVDYTFPVNADGTFSGPVPDLADGTYSYSMIASYDTGGFSKSTPTTGEFTVIELDPLAVTSPLAVDATVGDTITITGTADPRTTLEASYAAENVAVAVAAAATSTAVEIRADGTFSFDMEINAYGNSIITLTDSYANAVVATQMVTATTAVPAPAVTTAPGATLNTGGSLTGTGIPGAEVTVAVNTTVLTVTVGADGTWTVALPADLPGGDYTVSATQAINGVTSEASAPITVKVAAPASGATVAPTTNGGGGGLAQTGASSIVAIGAVMLALLAAGGFLLYRKRRHGSAS